MTIITSPQKILVTGGHGDIAQAIKNKLQPSYAVFTPNKEILDVTNEAQIEKCMSRCKPDILINCAGYIEPLSLENLTIDNLRKHIDINLIGSAMCAKYAIQYGATFIINIGSSAGVRAKKTWLSYCISKGALNKLTECIMLEGTDAVTLHLSRTDTQMRAKLFPNEGKELLLTPTQVADAVDEILRYQSQIKGKHLLLRQCNYYENKKWMLEVI